MRLNGWAVRSCRGGAVLIAAAALPLLVALVRLLIHPTHVAALGDDAVIERTVRAVGVHEVLLGPYSRFGWHHPGPSMFYLLAGPYRLLGGWEVALPATTLALNTACIVGIALLLRRRAGGFAMIWGLLVLAVFVRAQEAGFLVNDWNPYLPLLPFTLGALLCWTLLAGDRWALPLCLAIATLCAQSHVGYLLGVVALALVTVLCAIVRRWTKADGGSRTSSDLRRWTVPVISSFVVLVLLWSPVAFQQFSGHPGNLTLLARYFSATKPTWSYTQGLHELSTSLARLPAFAVGVEPRPQFLRPDALPTSLGLIGALALVLAAVWIFRTQRTALPLVALVFALAIAVVIAVQRVVGPLFSYLVPFTWATGVLAWITVGVALTPVVESLSERLAAARAERPIRIGSALVAIVALLVAFFGTAAEAKPAVSFNGPDVVPVADDVRAWATTHPGTIRLEDAPTRGLVGATAPAMGVFIRLERKGVPVRLSHRLDVTLGPQASAGVERAVWVVQIAATDGTSSPPGPGQTVLSRHGAVQAYVSRLPPPSP